jgi:hypothetical protein
MNERGKDGELVRPWMQTNHPKYNYVQAQLSAIEARHMSDYGDLNVVEALDELDKMLMPAKAKSTQSSAPRKGIDPMGGSNLTKNQQRAKMKLSPQEEAIAYKLGLTPDAYLSGKRRTGQI